MALSFIIDAAENAEKQRVDSNTEIRRMLHRKDWNEHVFIRLTNQSIHKYTWDKTFDQEFPVFVCDPKIQGAVALKRFSASTIYTGDSPVDHYLVSRVFPMSANHTKEYFLVPERVRCENRWVELVLPMPKLIVRYVEKLSDHGKSMVYVSTCKDNTLERSGKEYYLEAFMDMVRQDTDGKKGFKMALEAIFESFPIARDYFKCYGNVISTSGNEVAVEAGQIRESIGFCFSSFDDLEYRASHVEMESEKPVINSELASWYTKLCELP